MIAPIVLNDNLVDLIVDAGSSVGAPAKITVSPETKYLRVINRVRTGPADSGSDGDITVDSLNRDGSRTIVVTGRKRLGGPPGLLTYKVAEPERFAAAGLERALAEAGVVAGSATSSRAPVNGDYTADRLVADHVSPPFAEAVKVILKVSQNLHASMMPYLVGALSRGGKSAEDGFDAEREFLMKAGLDISGAVQSDGAGGAALYTPDFVVSFLQYVAKQKSAAAFQKRLPILGVDGTLAKISRGSAAAGHVYAKTGTFVDGDLLNRGLVVQGKGLAGYITTKSGRRLAFAVYINRIKLNDPAQVQTLVGQAVGDIAAAVYDVVP